MLFLSNLNLNQNELQNVVLQNLAGDPETNSLKAGQFWFNTTTHKYKFYDGTTVFSFLTRAELDSVLDSYKTKTGSSDPATSTVGIVGQHYYNTSTNKEFICTAVTPGTDPDPTTYTWEPVIKVTASKALVSDANGQIIASSVTATELGSLSGITGNIQSQLNNIAKINYLDGVSCTVSDGATQSEINTAATTALTTAYPSPTKYDGVNVAIKFTPSDIVKDGVYVYNGTTWAFQYYATTGIQRANGTTAGIIEEAASNSDLTLVDGVATVNTATKLRTARNITVEGDYNDGTAKTDGITATAASFDGSGNATIKITAIKTAMLDGALPVSKGGTGKTSVANGKVLVGNASGGFDEVGVDTAVTASSTNFVTSGAVAAAISSASSGVHKYTANNPELTITSGSAAWTVTHNLDTTAVVVQLVRASDSKVVVPEVTVTSANVVTIGINASATIAANTYTVTVLG